MKQSRKLKDFHLGAWNQRKYLPYGTLSQKVHHQVVHNDMFVRLEGGVSLIGHRLWVKMGEINDSYRP